MRQFTAFCICLVVALIAMTVHAQSQDTATHWVYDFRVPLDDANKAITTIPTSCTGASGFIAGQIVPTAWIILQVPRPSDPNAQKPTYAFTATNSITEECRNGVNADVTAWKQNFVTSCISDRCGGSFPCSCAGGAECVNTFSGTVLETPAFCNAGYICNGTVENSGVGTCQEALVGFKITMYLETFTEAQFYNAARSPACLQYNIQFSYALQTTKDLYFTATTLETVSDECKAAMTASFGGELTSSTTECRSVCGAPGCVCELGNICSLTSNNNKQCAKKLKCVQGNSVLPTCSNSVVYSAAFAIIAAFVAVLM